MKSTLQNFINVSIKEEIQTSSEIGWISRDKLVLTLNNDFFLVNLSHKDLVGVKGQIKFGVQQVSMNLFCSIVRNIDSSLE